MAKKKQVTPIRKDLEDLIHRKFFLADSNRPDAIAKRHAKNQRTARENIADLCDDSSFTELGSLIVAAQRGRKSMKELIETSPADGLVTGIATVNGHLFGEEAAKCMVLSYDYTVMAGTQGGFNHKKTDRIMELAAQMKKPIVFFVEGGGGRPGDVDFNPIVVGGLDLTTWAAFSRLSGKLPRVAIAAGYCFAGNAAIAGCADVIIATKNTSIGMGGPAMIEGGGLGKFHPRDIGPTKIQAANGVIDIVVEDEAAAVAVAKQYVSYFQGRWPKWTYADQAQLRDLIPENRHFAYNVHHIILTLCDKDSVLELRAAFAKNMVTALVRIDGKAMGLIANSTRHLGGAIDSDAADKAARFMQLCDAFGLPIISLCDAPGFMVGPEHEKMAMVRHTSRMFIVGANLRVPMITIVLRKAYGLGAMAMAGGSFRSSFMTLSWPTGEFGAMGLEGAVKLGFKKELEAIPKGPKREALYEKLVKAAYTRGQAIQAATALEFDEVIDPAETRRYINQALNSIPADQYKNQSSRYIDSW